MYVTSRKSWDIVTIEARERGVDVGHSVFSHFFDANPDLQQMFFTRTPTAQDMGGSVTDVSMSICARMCAF